MLNLNFSYVIESFKTTYGPKSCNKKDIAPTRGTPESLFEQNFSKFSCKKMKKLYNNVWLVQFRRGKVAVHTFGCPQHSDHVRSLRNDMLHFRILLFFSLTSYPAGIAYLNSSNPELSNSVQVMKLYGNRNVDPSRCPCLKTVHRKSERGNFLVLHPVLKVACFNSAN